MNRIIAIFAMCILLINVAYAFDEPKAKSDYKGADFKVASIKESLYENAPAIIIAFTAPLSMDLLKNHHVSLEGGESDHWIINEDRTKLIFPFVSPETTYHVHVSNEIRDVNGQKLNLSQDEEIKTQRLDPAVNFTSSGHIISSSGAKEIPVTTLNVDEVNIDFFSIDQSKIPGILQVLNENGSCYSQEANQIKEYGKLVYTGRFELNPKKNQRTECNINLEEIGKVNEPGFYAAVLTVPGTYDYYYEYAYFMQTNIGLHLRRYEKSFDVYAQDVTSGKPIENVKIKILNRNGEILHSGKSDKLGKAGFHIQSDQFYIIATVDDQISVLSMHRNALDLSGLKNAVTTHSEYQIYAWGPRDLYRPSEKIKVNILVRNFDGKLPPSVPLACMLYKPDGSRIPTNQIQPTEQGFYTFEYQTGDSSQTGTYKLKLTYADSNTANYTFKVEEFLPERIDLTLFDGNTDEKRVLGKVELIEVPVTSNYLYGAPASGNKVDGFVVAEVDIHPFEDLPTFHFGDVEEKIEYTRCPFNEINLGDNGTGSLSMENKWSEMKSPVRLKINASAYETGGRPVTRRSSLTLLSGDRFLAIEPQFKENPDANTTVDIKVACVDRDGQWLKNQSVNVSLIRQDRNWYWRHSSSRGWHWAWDETPIVVFSKTVNTMEAGNALVSLPLSWGNYKVEVSDGDDFAGYKFKTSWSWWGNSSDGNNQKPDRVSLGFESSSYKPGDLATLRIDPPQAGMALITIESSSEVLFTKYMPVKSEGSLVKIQTDESWDRHDIYASVLVIRPGDMKETPVPTRAFGMIHMPLKRANTILDVDITAPERIEPNKKIKAKIKVSAGYPVSPGTKVVVSLVDTGILNITRFKTPDAESYFFGPRRYNIELYDNYGQVIDNIGPKVSRHRFGGGFSETDADIARGGDKPKSEVLMVSFFSDPLSLDENGEVEVGFDLPDFNGQLRWMVMVYADEQFGKAETDTKVADKIVTQLSAPRFLAPGDKSTIALDIRNMSDAPQKLTLAMNIEGSLKKSVVEKSILLNDREKTTLCFPIESVSSSGQGVIKISLSNDDKKIKVERTWRIGVRSPYPAFSRSSFEMIKANTAWKPEMKTDDFRPETVNFQMILSNKPPIDFAGHFNHLLNYPYGCLEQTTSSGYPWVLGTPEALSKMGLSDQVKKQFKREYDEHFRQQQIEAGIARALDRQKSNGSFGQWSSDSPEQKWLTVYATDFLNDASRAGVSVSTNALKNANNRLRKYLKGNFSSNNNRWTEDNNHYTFAFRSYAGYVLAKAGAVRIPDLRRLADQYKEKTNDDGLSWLYMAVSFKLAGDSNNSDICFKRAMKERNRAKHRYYGDYGSSARDLARINELVLAYDFERDGRLIFDLADTVKERTWLSTQERIALFRAALLMEDLDGDTWMATLATDQMEQKLERSRAFNTLFDLEAYEGLKNIKAFNDSIYANITLVGEPKKAPIPQSNEITIERKFYDTNGNMLVLDQMKSGELAVVRLILSALSRTPDGLVVDLLPAGVEIENQNLGFASIYLDDIKLDGKLIGELRDIKNVKHEEFRDDRYVAAVDIEPYGNINLFYLIRAVTPGIYKMPCSYVEDMYRPYRFGIGTTIEQIKVFE